MKLIIGWLYPSLMNVYGDRGNITVLEKRSKWRGIETEIKYLDAPLSIEELRTCDLLMMGGAQDEQQKIVSEDLKMKKKFLSEMIENEIPGLYVCGAYQFLGNFYKEADGTEIPGLGIFDLHTINLGNDRLIGNIATSSDLGTLIGFENHGGRTYLGKNIKALAHVLKGFGNNGEDQNEGAIYKNSLGTYMHGPLLPKNPKVADFVISKALEVKYNERVELRPLDDSLEEKARESILKRLEVQIDGKTSKSY